MGALGYKFLRHTRRNIREVRLDAVLDSLTSRPS